MKLIGRLLIVLSVVFTLPGCGDTDLEATELQSEFTTPSPSIGSEPTEPPANSEEGETESLPACVKSLYYDQLQPVIFQRNCTKANSSQRRQVEAGNKKKDQFLSQCYKATNNSCWCDQLVRPNPASINTFFCTYGNDQVHQLIHPDESTWKHAFEAVKIVEEFARKKLHTEIIYNWWRPEPYNKNVGGSPTRHPFGTAVDVRFMTKSIQNKAFSELCKMRRQGRIRAIGYYASTAIHFGIGDNSANTWGKACP